MQNNIFREVQWGRGKSLQRAICLTLKLMWFQTKVKLYWKGYFVNLQTSCTTPNRRKTRQQEETLCEVKFKTQPRQLTKSKRKKVPIGPRRRRRAHCPKSNVKIEKKNAGLIWGCLRRFCTSALCLFSLDFQLWLFSPRLDTVGTRESFSAYLLI